MATYSFDVWLYSDFSGELASAPVTGSNDSSTTGGDSTGNSTLASGATQVTLTFDDDDAGFSDGFLDTGTGQVLTSDMLIGSTTYAAGSTVELEYILTDPGPPSVEALVIRIDGENVLIFAPDAVPGTTYDFSVLEDEATRNYDILCFARGTQIGLDKSTRAVEDLKVRDLVENKAGELVEIRWIGKSKLSSAKLAQFPHLRPIQISAGALGENTPNRDLTVSPQHRIFLNDWRAELMFGFSSFLAPAKTLMNDNDIKLAPINEGVEYFHVMFDKHEIISANGQWTESFFPGGQALTVLEQAAQDELFEIFPELRDGTNETYPMAAPSLKSFELKALQGS